MIKQLMSKLRFTESKYFFYTILIINIILVCFTKLYPSMDGPAHLYNSNLLKEFISGNELLKDYYSINSIIIPNWASHFLLAVFNFIFTPWLSEKLLIILYISGMALSFRYLLTHLNKTNVYLSVLIFPFIYSFLFHLGFYNFSISFVFYFLTLGYYLQHRSKNSISNYIILSVLFIFTYLSNALTYGFLGLTIGAFIIYSVYDQYINNNTLKSSIKYGIKKILLLLIITLPSLIMISMFLNEVTFFPSEQSYSTKELLKWINDARPFIVYDYTDEEVTTEQYFHVFILLITLMLFNKIKFEDKKIKIKSIDVTIIPIITSTILLFTMPNGSGAGMMSDRYCLMIFVFGLVWISARAIHTKFNRIIILLIVLLHIGLQFKHLNGTIKNLNRDALTIYQAQDYVDENNIVLPINLSSNWLEPHFSNYLGIDKPMIILENYEVSVGWFPLKWKDDNFPNILLGNKNSITGVHWKNNTKSNVIRQIDNILLYGDVTKINEPKMSELKEILKSDFKLKYKSPNSFVMLYERI